MYQHNCILLTSRYDDVASWTSLIWPAAPRNLSMAFSFWGPSSLCGSCTDGTCRTILRANCGLLEIISLGSPCSSSLVVISLWTRSTSSGKPRQVEYIEYLFTYLHFGTGWRRWLRRCVGDSMMTRSQGRRKVTVMARRTARWTARQSEGFALLFESWSLEDARHLSAGVM